ncbi:MAG: AAA family ATPase [Spirochaetales bacterium]|nr:AAA family ATPase [Spirochaetales bacterium]
MAHNKKIVATVGLCGSGKSVVGDYLVKKGCVKIYFGEITIETVKQQGLAVTEENERKVREELRQQYGMGAYATLNLPKIEQSLKNGKKVLIDGLYSFTEYKILKEKYNGSLFILSIFTPRELRYERLSKRKVRPLTRYEAVSRDYAEIENIQKAGPIAMADYTLINDSTVKDLLHKLDEILNQENFF